jgi:ketosteroid isomerase-like protein
MPAAQISPQAALIERFYLAFSRRDWAGMVECYHPQVHFTDEVFDLQGIRAGLMWRMLTTAGKDMALEFSGIQADAQQGRAHWEAQYTFSATGRKVHNRVDAEFEFRDGLIVRHIDRFDFWAWSRQALGAPGLLLGWSPMLRKKVQATAARNLAGFEAKVSSGVVS